MKCTECFYESKESRCEVCDKSMREFKIKQKYKAEWERLETGRTTTKDYNCVDRLKVHGGWIVNQLTVVKSYPCMSSVFIPDPQHEWEIEK